MSTVIRNAVTSLITQLLILCELTQ